MENYVFDIDGTISEQGNPISNEISKGIERLLDIKKTIIFASARPVRDMLPMVSERLRKEATFIGCNGGMAFKNGSMLYSKNLNNDYVSNTINVLKKFNIPYVLDGTWGFSVSEKEHDFHDYIRSLSSYEEKENDLLLNGVTKILVLPDHTNIDELLSILASDQISIHIHSKEYFFDLTVKGNNKYNTILTLINGKYMAFGNDKNDFLMLDHAQKSVFIEIETETDYNKADHYLKFEEVADFINRL